MTLSLSFYVEGEPKPQPRPRVTIRGGYARAYNPPSADGWKTRVRFAAHAEMLENEWPIKTNGRFELAVFFNLPPKKTKRAKGPPKFDLDNGVKAIMDALTDAGVWADDNCVVRLRVEKDWAFVMKCGARIYVERIGP